MKSWHSINLISSATDLFNLKQAALNAYHGIYLDYFERINFFDFENHHMYHESVVMKAAAYRFLTPDIQSILYDAATSSASLDRHSHSFHPIFYLRLSKPQSSRPQIDSPLLDSQPHFDRSFGVAATSFWLALEDANIKSGGLCFFKEPILEFHAEWGEPNRYNYQMYLADHKLLDPVIQPKIVHPQIHAGSAYVFDSDTLHAATRPDGGVRLSFDFRIAARSKLTDLDDRSQSIFEIAHRNIALSNAMNLSILGDKAGARRYVERYKLDAGVVSSVVAKTDIRESNNRMIWRNEYSWIDLLLADKVKLRAALGLSESTVSAGGFEL